MTTNFLLYGANGYVGEAAAQLAVAQGLRPVLAGRNAAKLEPLAQRLGLEFRACALDDAAALDRALRDMPVVLHCAGPYKFTSKPLVDACLRCGVHYLDLTGEIPVFEALAARDAQAKARKVMLLPAVGFDVVPTDCLAVHLSRRLPGAKRLALAFQSVGRAGLPPGTQRTMIELLPFGDRVRRGGELVVPESGVKRRSVDFGQGPVEAIRFTWGDVFTAYHSTGIPDIEVYAALPPAMRRQMALLKTLRPLFRLASMRAMLQRGVQPGPSAELRATTVTHVWGEVSDAQGHSVVSRLHGPEAGLVWTTRAALAAVKRVLGGSFAPGFQTPGKVFGADFVLESEGVWREDLG
ncbi:MAG: saccharopine dehydrogenase NADP-binding domain-containing protein [Burkholderiaceae bacterium]